MLLTPLEQFQIIKLLPLVFLGLDFSVTNFLVINILTLGFFISIVYYFSIKQNITNQTAFFLIPNSWQVCVETLYDVVSQLLFDNVNIEGDKKKIDYLRNLINTREANAESFFEKVFKETLDPFTLIIEKEQEEFTKQRNANGK